MSFALFALSSFLNHFLFKLWCSPVFLFVILTYHVKAKPNRANDKKGETKSEQKSYSGNLILFLNSFFLSFALFVLRIFSCHYHVKAIPKRANGDMSEWQKRLEQKRRYIIHIVFELFVIRFLCQSLFMSFALFVILLFFVR